MEKGKITAILLLLKQAKTKAMVLNSFTLNIKIWILVWILVTYFEVTRESWWEKTQTALVDTHLIALNSLNISLTVTQYISILFSLAKYYL